MSMLTPLALAVSMSLASVACAQHDHDTQPHDEHADEEVQVRETPIEVNDHAPAFELRSDKGDWVSLETLLEDGPVIVTFYRGAWCPYCVKELGSLEENRSRIAGLGATLVAIAPERSENAERLRTEFKIGFRLLHDEDNAAAKSFGLWFELDEKTVELYKNYGIDVGAANATGAHELPIPATYIIDTDGVVRYAFVEEDYRKRADPEKIIAALTKIVTEDETDEDAEG